MKRKRTIALLATAVLVVFSAVLFVCWRPYLGKADPSIFENAAFVSVDFQPTSSNPQEKKQLSDQNSDVQQAQRYLANVALPNGRRVADACRSVGIPMVFIHWGYVAEDGMDLEPRTRKTFLRQIGPDTSSWPFHMSRNEARPSPELEVRRGEYVVAKTGQDGFTTSNLGFVLENLEIDKLIFVGGHTGGCLWHTARSAMKRGYTTMCISDATYDAFASRHMGAFDGIGCDFTATTEELEALAAEYRRKQDDAGP